MPTATSFDTLASIVPVSDQARGELTRRMRAPDRFYHRDEHLALLWQRHRSLGQDGAFHVPHLERLIASAIAFHDVVLDTTRADNEAASAALWREMAGAAGQLSPDEIDWVAVTIEATARHLAPWPAEHVFDRARIWVLDLDLTPLGECPAIFAQDTQRLRAEHMHLDAATWNRKRLGFLAQLARAPRLFRTSVIADAFEAPAQANLRRELAGWTLVAKSG
jgi:predicted metal-dependent HD superfamily phosphohydrolase